jgi:PAS domain S-box-containing protein
MITKPKLFFIEDEILVFKTYQHLLKENYTILGCAFSYDDALKKIENTQPDLIIADINIKGTIDGIDTAERLQLKFDIPVIFVSAYMESSLLEKTPKIKDCYYLTKPINTKTLLSTIEIALYRKKYDAILLDSITDGYIYSRVIYDNEKNITDLFIISINESFRKMTGLNNNDVCGKYISSIYPKNSSSLKNILLPKISTIKKLNEPIEFQYYEDFNKKWYFIKAYFPKGSYIIFFIYDIQSREEKENLILQYYKALKMIPSIIVLTDLNGKILYVNPAFEISSGFCLNEVVGLNPNILKSGEHDKSFYNKLWTTITKGKVWRGMLCNKAKDGDLYYESATIGCIKDKNGNITNYIKTSEDISQIKYLENKMVKSQEKYYMLFNNMINGFAYHKIIIDKVGQPIDCKFIEVNKSFEKMTGLKRTQIIGKTFKEIFLGFENEISEWIEIYSKVALENQTVKFQKFFIPLNKWFAVTAFSFKKCFFATVFDDITEMKKKESEVKHKQIQLIQSGKLAAIGQLAAGIAHEINQPLSGISMGIDNIIYKLKSNILKEDYLENKCESLISYVDRIKSIIEHIRIFSREQKNEQLKKINIIDSINNALMMLKTQYTNHNIEIIFNPKKDKYIIVGNEYKLEQIILNVMTNAKDSVNEKYEILKKENKESDYQRKIELSINETDSEIIIMIKDNGIGISKENIDEIFVPFFTTKLEDKGTGLGLSITNSLVEEMNGIIKVDSHENEGTSFIIAFVKSL